MHGLARANRHWTDEEWAACCLAELEARPLIRQVWSGIVLVLLAVWGTVLLLAW